MNRPQIPSKLYSQLTPYARLSALTDAHKRRDTAEVSRLLDTAPGHESDDQHPEPRGAEEVAAFFTAMLSGIVRALSEEGAEPEDIEAAKGSLGEVLKTYIEGTPISDRPGLANPESVGFQFGRAARIRRKIRGEQSDAP